MTLTIAYTLAPSARISAGKGGEVLNSRAVHTVVPGSVIRGALGAAWWTSPDDHYAAPRAQAAFDRLFSRSMRVGIAVPQGSTSAMLEPLSWVRCKYPDPGRGCSGEWHDSARDVLALGAVSADDSAGGMGRTQETRIGECPGCRRPYDEGRGWRVPETLLTSATRTALVNGSARDEQLFTRRAIATRESAAVPAGSRSPVRLHGRLVLAEEPSAAVRDWLLAPKVLRVGGQLSTMGACAWAANIVDEPAAPPTGDIVVRLVSPAILVDGYGAPSLDLAGAVAQLIGDANGRGSVERQWVRPEVVTGWHALAGVFKPQEWGVAAGSVVLARGCDATAAAALADGVGLRRQEGYGETLLVRVSDTVTVGMAGADPHAQVLVPRLDSAPPMSERRPAPTPTKPPEPPATDVAHDVEEAPQPDPIAASAQESADPVLRLLHRVADVHRFAVAKGMLAMARNVKRYRDRGYPGSIVAAQAERWTETPWGRTISGGLGDAVRDQLVDPDAAATIASLERYVEGHAPEGDQS